MSHLATKKILLAVSGSIAAYKAALLVRLLTKLGADVRVIMTEAATEFITPLTLATLSGHPVAIQFVDNKEHGTWTNHVELGLWADAMIIAPATARTLSKCATGCCDDLLSAVYLSARCPVFFAPAMDLDMYKHGSTQTNLSTLKSYGNIIIPSEFGPLASGLVGEGRMPEPETILQVLERHFAIDSRALGKKVVITAGPSQEAIDPVRYISNHSSGKMGYALANAFANAGCEVVLVSGPTSLEINHPNVFRLPVRSAQEMYEATAAHFTTSDLTIFAAAVADYTPEVVADSKIKKKESTFQLNLKKTVDIAGTLAPQKRSDQLTIGFALETDNELENALRKLQTKKFDYIVLNSLKDEGAGFAHDTNKVTIIDNQETIRRFDLKAKTELATDILTIILEKWQNE